MDLGEGAPSYVVSVLVCVGIKQEPASHKHRRLSKSALDIMIHAGTEEDQCQHNYYDYSYNYY